MKLSVRTQLLAVAATALLAATASAQTTLTFSGNVCTGNASSPDIAVPYLESGFQIAFAGLGYTYWCNGAAGYTGSPNIGIQPNYNALATLTKVGGGTFSLLSIDLASVYTASQLGAAGSVLFTGDLFGGGTVTQTLTWAAPSGSPTNQTNLLNSNWNNLVDVYFSQPLPYFQFDNVVLDGTASSTVPEPATMTLLATGLAGMAAARRRKKLG